MPLAEDVHPEVGEGDSRIIIPFPRMIFQFSAKEDDPLSNKVGYLQVSISRLNKVISTKRNRVSGINEQATNQEERDVPNSSRHGSRWLY